MIKETAKVSLGLQFATTSIDIWGLQLPLQPKYRILKELLQLEIIVQIIELVFYIWLLQRFDTIKNITPYRYLDWIVTTPTMLIQLMIFLKYDSYTSISEFFKVHSKEVALVLLLNWIMMIIGLLGETNQISMDQASAFGFIPFVAYFGIIYNRFYPKDNHSNKIKQYLFYYYLIVWSLYGVASFLPYILKNSMFNILDVFAKNMYGLFLVWYIIYVNRN